MGATRPTDDGAKATTFGEILRRHRVAAGLSQEELAERAGLSTRGISDLERGTRTAPRKETIALLLDALRLPAPERSALLGAARRTPARRSSPSTAGELSEVAPLPVPLTPLVGRTREVAAIANLMGHEEVRLVTLTGPGGTGKTRLAIRVAQELEGTFRDGVAFVGLAPITDPTLVLPSVAHAVGVREGGDRPLIESLAAALRGRELLLVLDNVEQVVEMAPLVADLLAAAPGLKVLSTSRVPLRLSAEHRFPVPPLSLPSPSSAPWTENLARSEAVGLFIARAKAARPDFALTQANAEVVAAVCARLDGLPLAIELAAARVVHLSPAALLARLEHRLPLLTGGAQDLPQRQRTMRDTIAWSHDLLPSGEQVLIRRLAAFIGGFTLDAVEPVATPSVDLGLDALDGVASLVDKSLLRQEDGGDGESRYQMLETVREFALERLSESSEEAVVRRRHAGFYRALVQHAVPSLNGPGQAAWLDRLEAEFANLRAAVLGSLEHNDTETGLQISIGLWRYWMVRGHVREARDWLDRLLARRDGVPPTVLTEALAVAADLAEYQGDSRRASLLAEEALALARKIDDRRGGAMALYALGEIAKHHEERFDEAIACFEDALARFQAVGDRAWTVEVLIPLADVWRDRGDPARAVALLGEALDLAREVGDVWSTACALRYLADAVRDQGDHVQSLALDQESLTLHHALDDRWGILSALTGLAMLAARWDQPERAVRLLGVREVMRETLGLPPVWPQHRRWYDPLVAKLRDALGESPFAAAWASGRSLTLDEAVSEGLSVTPPPAAPAPQRRSDPALGTGMTSRELEVLGLLVEGHSNREIAEALFVSSRTVDTHVTAILAKLEAKSRTAAVTAARRLGLA